MHRPVPAWSSRYTFLLAAVGAAVGLGNIWKFPYMAGTNGGGAFVLIYLLCAVAIAIPILLAELLIGRRGAQSPPTAMANVAHQESRSPHWALVGWVGSVVGFLIVSFYSVIAGWAMAYVAKAATGQFSGFDAAASRSTFDQLLADPLALSAWHGTFILTNIFILARGLSSGIEATIRVLMPTLFIMLAALVIYAAFTGAFGKALHFLFAFELADINGNTVLMAVGQAFFSIGVAMGLMMMYGAYMPPRVSLTHSALLVAFADTLVALLAGLAIFPLVFGNGLDPAQGPGLIFVTLPIAFGNMPLGSLFGAVFFIALTFAAVTSSIALLEPLVARITENRHIGRTAGTISIGIAAWLVGLGTVFSFNYWAAYYPLDAFAVFAGKSVFDLIDYLTANILMPLGGVAIAVFTGWCISKKSLIEELQMTDNALFRLWHWLIKFAVPSAIGLVFLANLS